MYSSGTKLSSRIIKLLSPPTCLITFMGYTQCVSFIAVAEIACQVGSARLVQPGWFSQAGSARLVQPGWLGWFSQAGSARFS